MGNLWIPEHVKIRIDDYENMPTGNIVSFDLETNELEPIDPNFKLVCVGLSDGRSCWVYFDIRPELIEYLRQSRWILQDGIHAELPWMNKLYGGFAPEHIYYDCKLGGYVHDSTKKNYGLKAQVAEYLGVKYPTYSEIVGSTEYISRACVQSPELLVTFKKGTKAPKKLSLDKLDKEVVANYNAADTYYTWKLFEYFKKHETTAKKLFLDNIEMPTNKLIARMEAKGIKIDTKEIRRIHNETSKDRRQSKKELFRLAGKDFNPNSPKQVMEVLGMQGIKSKSTGEDDLIRFKDTPFVSALLKYRGLQKVCSTYTIPLYFNAVKSGDSRIHTRFGQNTITGRLSSSDPINLQNQPPSVRSGFVSQQGSSFIDADWSNLEIYLPAHFSGESEWINVLRRPDGDLHMATAERLFGKRIYSLAEVERKAKRKIAKETLLTITNSGTFKSLAKTLQCSEKEAKEFEAATKSLYPTYMKWLETTKKEARKHKGISTYFGRWVPFAQLDLWCGRSGCPIFGENGYFCKQCFMRQETEKQAISVKVQGTGGDLIKMAALRLYKEYGYVPNALVHDEILMETPDSEIEQTTERVRYVMQNLWSFTVPLKAEIKIAKNWKDSH